MMQNVVREIGGVGLYGVVSILLFTFVFGGALIWAVFMKKSVAEQLSALPLEEEDHGWLGARGRAPVNGVPGGKEQV